MYGCSSSKMVEELWVCITNDQTRREGSWHGLWNGAKDGYCLKRSYYAINTPYVCVLFSSFNLFIYC